MGVPNKEQMENGNYRSSWAVYMKNDDNNGLGTLSIPSLRLRLNLKKLHGDVIKETKTNTKYVDKDGLCKDAGA